MLTVHAKASGVFELDLDTVPVEQLYEMRHAVEAAILKRDGVDNTPSLTERGALNDQSIADVVKRMSARLNLSLLDARKRYERWRDQGKFEPIQESDRNRTWTSEDLKAREENPTREELVQYYEQGFTAIVFSLKDRFKLTITDARDLFNRWKSEGKFDQ